jgi:hypothetical protein
VKARPLQHSPATPILWAQQGYACYNCGARHASSHTVAGLAPAVWKRHGRGRSTAGKAMTSGGKRYTNRVHAEAMRWQDVAGHLLTVGTLSRKSVRSVRRSLISDARKLWRSCWRRCRKVQRRLFRKVPSSWNTPDIHTRSPIQSRSQQPLHKARCGRPGDMPFG